MRPPSSTMMSITPGTSRSSVLSQPVATIKVGDRASPTLAISAIKVRWTMTCNALRYRPEMREDRSGCFTMRSDRGFSEIRIHALAFRYHDEDVTVLDALLRLEVRYASR